MDGWKSHYGISERNSVSKETREVSGDTWNWKTTEQEMGRGARCTQLFQNWNHLVAFCLTGLRSTQNTWVSDSAMPISPNTDRQSFIKNINWRILTNSFLYSIKFNFLYSETLHICVSGGNTEIGNEHLERVRFAGEKINTVSCKLLVLHAWFPCAVLCCAEEK